MSKRFRRMPLRQLAKPRARYKQPEHAECKAFYGWYLLNRKHFRIPCMIFHVPNEGKRSYRVGALLKAMGLVPGVPDYVCIPNKGTAFFIEFKDKKRKLTENQEAFRLMCSEMGIDWFLVRSSQEAIEVLKMKGIIQ